MAVNATEAKRLKEYIAKGWEFHIIEMLHDLKPVEIAELIEALDEESRGKLFRLLDVSTASEVISELSSDSREDVLDDISDSALAKIVEDMDSDDAADLVADLKGERAERVLASISPKESSEIRSLLRYPEDTAGGIMQSEIMAVPSTTSVDAVITQIRQRASEIDNIHTIFVTDNNSRLVGSVPLVKLILAKPETPIFQIMDLDPLKVPVTMDQEDVARLFKKYDTVVMPVVDKDNRLLGRITVAELVDVTHEEH